MVEDKNYSHLAEQWHEESSQMIISEDEAKKTREELRKMKTDDFNWDVVVPKIYPRNLKVNVIDIVTGKIDDISEVIEEHIEAIEGFKKYHKKFGYDETRNLIDFYQDVYKKMPEHENPDPNFDFEKLVKAYEGSTKKK